MSNWSTVTTVHAPISLILIHILYHRQLHPKFQIYFIDNPEYYHKYELDLLTSIEGSNIILCDDAYWEAQGGRPEIVPERQILNIKYARESFDSEWLLHIDIDELLHTTIDIGSILSAQPKELCEFRIQNVERLIVRGQERWHSGVIRLPCYDQRIIEKYYEDRRHFLGMGLSNYYHGKSFVRNIGHVFQSLHGSIHEQKYKEIVRMQFNLEDTMVVHYPFICMTQFIKRSISKNHKINRSRKFIHERKFDTYIDSKGNDEEIIKKLALYVHSCTGAESRLWILAGLCRSMPDLFTKRVEACVLHSDELSLSHMDRQYSEFNSRRGNGPTVGGSVIGR